MQRPHRNTVAHIPSRAPNQEIVQGALAQSTSVSPHRRTNGGSNEHRNCGSWVGRLDKRIGAEGCRIRRIGTCSSCMQSYGVHSGADRESGGVFRCPDTGERSQCAGGRIYLHPLLSSIISTATALECAMLAFPKTNIELEGAVWKSARTCLRRASRLNPWLSRVTCL